VRLEMTIAFGGMMAVYAAPTILRKPARGSVPFGVCTLCDLASDNSEMTLLGRDLVASALSCLALLKSDTLRHYPA
jgi:hypothetical protein